MNPQVDYEDYDTETARAFMTLFRRVGGEFQYSIDSSVGQDEEVRGAMASDPTVGSVIIVTAVNEEERFQKIVDAATDMNLSVETERSEGHDEEIGDYVSYSMEAYADGSFEYEWSVPHLLIYGHLRPEMDEILSAYTNSKDIQFCDVRNHVLVFGEDVDRDTQDDISSRVSSSNRMFADDQRQLLSDVRTADLL